MRGNGDRRGRGSVGQGRALGAWASGRGRARTASSDGGAKSHLGRGVNRRNLKFITSNTHYKPGLVLELNSSCKERGKQINKNQGE
jgi:hypothetical protein